MSLNNSSLPSRHHARIRLLISVALKAHFEGRTHFTLPLTVPVSEATRAISVPAFLGRPRHYA